MEALKSYILQNWVLIMILGAFLIVLKFSPIMRKKRTRRMYFLIAFLFIVSVSVFVEFYIEANAKELITLRTYLMTFRFSATPFIMAYLMFALVRKQKCYVFIPAAVLFVLNFVSIFTGIVASVGENNTVVNGPLWLLPFIGAGAYFVYMILVLILQSNKRRMEIVPIIFLAISCSVGSAFPFIFGSQFSEIYCTTVGAGIFIYYVFLIIQLSNKDALTGVLNRQAFNAETSNDEKEITAMISIDTNELKATNDTYGHAAGDEELITLALCFIRACNARQSVYRIGGDEFVIVCRKTSEIELMKLVDRVEKHVAETKYTCSLGYSFRKDYSKDIPTLLKESDAMMYKNKTSYYQSKS